MNIFVESGGQILADEIGFDGQFAMAAIDQDGQLDAPGPAEIVERIHGGADGASAEEDIVDEDDGFAADVEGDDGGLDVGSNALIEVIAMHADVERAERDGVGPDVGEDGAEALSEGDAAALDADEGDVGAGFVAFGDFVADTSEGALDGRGVEDGVRIQGRVGLTFKFKPKPGWATPRLLVCKENNPPGDGVETKNIAMSFLGNLAGLP